MTKFRIDDFFQLPRLHQTIIVGEVLNDAVEVGMMISSPDIPKLAILGVEFIDGKKEGKVISKIGLRVKQFTPFTSIIGHNIDIVITRPSKK
jgi:hypothetical protein